MFPSITRRAQESIDRVIIPAGCLCRREDSRKPLDSVLNVLRGAHLPVEIFLLLAGEKALEV